MDLSRDIRKITFKELRNSVAQYARALRKMGLEKGDNVAGKWFFKGIEFEKRGSVFKIRNEKLYCLKIITAHRLFCCTSWFCFEEIVSLLQLHLLLNVVASKKCLPQIVWGLLSPNFENLRMYSQIKWPAVCRKRKRWEIEFSKKKSLRSEIPKMPLDHFLFTLDVPFEIFIVHGNSNYLAFIVHGNSNYPRRR